MDSVTAVLYPNYHLQLGCHGGDQTVYMLRDEAGKTASWTRASAPPEFSGHVQAACFLEI